MESITRGDSGIWTPPHQERPQPAQPAQSNLPGSELCLPYRLGWAPPSKYQVRRVIGSGAMGTVLLARDRGLGRLVAIKVLSTDCSLLLARLRHEAQLLARLEHPSIVRVHELDVHAGRLYLVMEYAAGGNLAGLRLPPRETVMRVRGVVDALAHAHAHGVVHRDVKPENVLLLDQHGRPRAGRVPAVLADFGLASGPDEGSPTLRRPISGTPVTMSPEQINGDAPGPAGDVFSFGVTLYRVLTARWPFPGRTVLDVFQRVREEPPDPMSVPGRPIPARLESVLLRTLEKRPEDRIASMDELGRALDRFVRGRTLFPLDFLSRAHRTEPARIHPWGLA